jgi:integral membrane protein
MRRSTNEPFGRVGPAPRNTHTRAEASPMSEELQRLRFASIAEAVTLAVLVAIAVPLRHLADWEPGVKFVGPIHGFAFLLYVWSVVQAVSTGNWTAREVARLAVVAFIPFGGFTTIGLIRRKAASAR